MKHLSLNEAIRIRVNVKSGVWTVMEAAVLHGVSKSAVQAILARRSHDWKPAAKVEYAGLLGSRRNKGRPISSSVCCRSTN